VGARSGSAEVTAEEFGELYRSLSSWGRWGESDERGALNLLGPEQVVEAAGLVREGTSVTLSLPLNTEAAPDNPDPAVHFMTSAATDDTSVGRREFGWLPWQRTAVERVQSAVTDNRLPHALLVHGPSGVGKDVFAWTLAATEPRGGTSGWNSLLMRARAFAMQMTTLPSRWSPTVMAVSVAPSHGVASTTISHWAAPSLSAAPMSRWCVRHFAVS